MRQGRHLHGVELGRLNTETAPTNDQLEFAYSSLPTAPQYDGGYQTIAERLRFQGIEYHEQSVKAELRRELEQGAASCGREGSSGKKAS